MKIAHTEIKEIVKSVGLVFGDIGTSPIYTLTTLFSFAFLAPTPQNVIGIISLILWTLILLVTVKYTWLVMSLSKKAEGGTIVLKEILSPLLHSKKKIIFVTILTFVGISLLIGDGVITPAVTILGAVEGLLYIPGLEILSVNALATIAAIAALCLFLFQKRGADKIAIAFGPIMIVWFLALSFFGLVYILKYPAILAAFNPYYGIKFILTHKLFGFFMLSFVILCATGAEALYADMGHLGRAPIVKAWYFVFFALALNYLGQGVFILQNPIFKNSLFGMVFEYSPFLYIPFLILSFFAAIIASQAIISGVFSIMYQGITTRIMPIFKVDYTSSRLRSQIYIGFANWFLLLSVLFIIFFFKESTKLTAAYGFAVSGTMFLTGIMATWVFYLRKNYFKAFISFMILCLDFLFLLATLSKVPQGAYISIAISCFPLFLILIYTLGQRKIRKTLKPIALNIFVDSFEEVYGKVRKIKGTALFFSREINKIPPYITKTMLMDHIIYEENIVVSILVLDEPFGLTGYFEKNICEGLKAFRIKAGYMEVLNVEAILKKFDVDEKVIFYGIEDIVSRNIFWRLFSLIKKVTPSYIHLCKLPAEKLHGVVNQIEL
ncbi:TPA: potassium transporter Kup [Candidatus Dependentiae bacterium]|nr:MAG: putative potassium transport system protein kup [candidate division TM6 bacterium GW2011_GWE2_31_21]KKP54057.1 MAG: putative potassium transport system protein kup [candidate division TM6 bacterium GW2011_GWF2_33_332]HBS48361.1 potassium transporter Kup [Candidatus Dependentiae bacterium]HBZ72965.1 potassium transporter Kup [Candidatus Dependentiae bacterium]